MSTAKHYSIIVVQAAALIVFLLGLVFAVDSLWIWIFKQFGQ